MKDYLNLYWLIPGVPFLFLLIIVVFKATGPSQLGSIATGFYKPMFLLTPTIGVLVMISLLLIAVINRELFKRISFSRTLTFALLDMVSPPIFLILGIVFSGFTR